MEKLVKLERQLGRFTVPHLTLWIMIGQIFIYGMEALNEISVFRQFPIEAILLMPAKVIEGEVWRLVTFVFQKPMTAHPIWLIFAWGIFFMTGSALEHTWGNFKYNLFIWIYVLATGIASMVLLLISPKGMQPFIVVSNFYLLQGVFLAFAYLNPNIEFRLYFVLPVKVKWLGILALAFMVFDFVFGSAYNRIIILASLVNLTLFLGKDILQGFKVRQRRAAHERKMTKQSEEAFHTCKVCDATDKSHPDRDFFYHDGDGYCDQCLDQMPD